MTTSELPRAPKDSVTRNSKCQLFQDAITRKPNNIKLIKTEKLNHATDPTSVIHTAVPKGEIIASRPPVLQCWWQLRRWDVQVHCHQWHANQTHMKPPFLHDSTGRRVAVLPLVTLQAADSWHSKIPKTSTTQDCTWTVFFLARTGHTASQESDKITQQVQRTGDSSVSWRGKGCYMLTSRKTNCSVNTVH